MSNDEVRPAVPPPENERVKRWLPLAHQVAHKHYWIGVEHEDLFAVACMGLLRAVRQYDANAGASFSTFATVCMTYAIRNAYRKEWKRKQKGVVSCEFYEREHATEWEPSERISAPLRRAIDEVTGLNKLVLLGYVVEERTLQSLATELGYSRQGIKNRLDATLSRLRAAATR